VGREVPAVTYSQGREDEIITNRAIALGLNHKSSGWILDVGAYDGVKFSNSRKWIEKGWGGVLVEPSPTVYPTLEALYAKRFDVHTLNKLITHLDHGGDTRFWDANGDGTSTTDPAHREKWAKAGSKFTQTTVDAYSWLALQEWLLDKDLQSTFDIISIDTESTSCALARTMPKAFAPKILIVEHDGDKQIRFDMEKRFGLHYIWHDGNNMIWSKT
jgi:hypothetical protein